MDINNKSRLEGRGFRPHSFNDERKKNFLAVNQNIGNFSFTPEVDQTLESFLSECNEELSFLYGKYMRICENAILHFQLKYPELNFITWSPTVSYDLKENSINNWEIKYSIESLISPGYLLTLIPYDLYNEKWLKSPNGYLDSKYMGCALSIKCSEISCYYPDDKSSITYSIDCRNFNKGNLLGVYLYSILDSHAKKKCYREKTPYESLETYFQRNYLLHFKNKKY